jgi:putative redox protein
MKIQKVWFENSKGQKLAGELWTPAKFKHTILLVNGIGNTKEYWEERLWPEKLAKLSYRVLIFDFRGRGESEGEFIETTLTSNIDDLKSALNYLNSNVTLISQSVGGATSICVASEDRHVKCLITRAASHNIDDWQGGKMLAEAKKKGFAIGSKPWKKYSLDLFEDFRKRGVLEKARKIKAPWLIIHGDKDSSTPIKQAKELYNAAKCAKALIIVKGADHDFTNKKINAEVFAHIKRWLERYLK